jgi:predicted O-methyltransferase YrrM
MLLDVTGGIARRALRWIEPYGVADRRRSRLRARAEAERLARYDATKAAIARSSEPIHDYEQLLVLAAEAGADPQRLRQGSITHASLDFILDRVDGGPGLHIGNYAGVSLAYLAANTDGLVVAVDPNVAQWGPRKAQDVVVRLLQEAGVENRVLLVCGYSLERNPTYNGSVIDGYDPSVEYLNEAAPVDVLQNLRSLGIRFGWVLLDGNHDASYLQAELEHVEPLLEDGGVVFLDDCNSYWPEIRAVFANSGDRWYPDGHDDRIGVLRRASASRGKNERQSQPHVVP